MVLHSNKRLAATLADVGLGTLHPAAQSPPALIVQHAYQAVGLLPAPGEGPGWGYWFTDQAISMEPNTNVNGGYSHGYGDEEYALGTLAMLLREHYNETQVLEVAKKHVTSFSNFRYVDGKEH